jgi:hypothetical protein
MRDDGELLLSDSGLMACGRDLIKPQAFSPMKWSMLTNYHPCRRVNSSKDGFENNVPQLSAVSDAAFGLLLSQRPLLQSAP